MKILYTSMSEKVSDESLLTAVIFFNLILCNKVNKNVNGFGKWYRSIFIHFFKA